MTISTRPSRSILEQVFFEDISPDFQKAMLFALGSAYDRSMEYCCPPRFGPNEALDLRGHLIRAHYETEFRRLNLAHNAVEAESRPNSRRSYYHSWIKVGRIYLTASSVREKSQKPRHAEFRNCYAQNGQLNLFEEVPPIDESEIYAVFRYGPLRAESPSIATVSFPNENWSQYVENIDLLALYPGIINAPQPVDVEVQDEPDPAMRLDPEEPIQEPQTPRLKRRRSKTAGEEDL